jgi:hypothetical protein
MDPIARNDIAVVAQVASNSEARFFAILEGHFQSNGTFRLPIWKPFVMGDCGGLRRQITHGWIKMFRRNATLVSFSRTVIDCSSSTETQSRRIAQVAGTNPGDQKKAQSRY